MVNLRALSRSWRAEQRPFGSNGASWRLPNYGSLPVLAPSAAVDLAQRRLHETAGIGESLRRWSAEQRESLLQQQAKAQEQSFALVTHERFEPLLLGVVLLNAAFIWIQIDFSDRVPANLRLAIDVMFNLIYSSEICLKILADGWDNFSRSGYNLFSCAATLVAWVDFLVYWTYQQAPHIVAKIHPYHTYVPTDIVQIFRVFRIVKLASISRTFDSLLRSLVLACREIVWVVVSGGILFYLSACVTTICIGDGDFHDSEGRQAPQITVVKARFQNLGTSMYYLFELMLFEGMGNTMRPFLSIVSTFEPILIFLMFFVVVSNFYLLNLCTAVVVNQMLQTHAQESEHERTRQVVQFDVLSAELHTTLLDTNAGGDEISWKHLKAWTREGTMACDILRRMGWSPNSLLVVFAVCEPDMEGRVSLRSMRGLWERFDVPTTVYQALDFHNHCGGLVDLMDSTSKLLIQAALDRATALKTPCKFQPVLGLPEG